MCVVFAASAVTLEMDGARVEFALDRLGSRDKPGTAMMGEGFLDFHFLDSDGLIAPILAAMPFSGDASERCRLDAVQNSLSSARSYSRKRSSCGSSNVHSVFDIR